MNSISDLLYKSVNNPVITINAQPTVEIEAPPPFFTKNNSSERDSFLSKISNLFSILEENKYLSTSYAQTSLPSLDQDQINQAALILTTPRLLKGRNNTFEVEFTLAELFDFLLKQRVLIQNIELIGSTVPWVLKNYIYDLLKHLGVENSKEWVPDNLLNKFASPPRDFDFRIHVPQASIQTIQYLKDCVINFFVEQKAKKNPYLNRDSFKTLVIDNGLTKLTKPKNLDQNLFSVVGLHDDNSGLGIDIIIYQKLERESLFISNGLFLNMLSLVKALKEGSTKSLKISPTSHLGNGSLSLFDKFAGIIRADKPENINCLGWPCLLISYLKGNRCLTSQLEQTLLNKLVSTLSGTQNEADMPPVLLAELGKLQKEATFSNKIAQIIAFWLKKAISSHLDNTPQTALTLILQACISLKQNKLESSIPSLWIAMKPLMTDLSNDPLFELFFKLMDLGAFEQLINLLEVRAFLSLSNSEKKPNFTTNLIYHSGNPAFQILIDKYSLLVPYRPSKAMLSTKESWKKSSREIQILLEKLDLLLQVQGCYYQNNTLPIDIPIIADIQLNFASPFDLLSLEWQLVSELNNPSIKGSQIILDHLLNSKYPFSKDQFKQLIKTAKKITSSEIHSKLYDTILTLLENNDYAKIAMPLIWAMALASLNETEFSHRAYTLWVTNSHLLSSELKTPFLKLFIRKLSVQRPDLGITLFQDLVEKLDLNTARPILLEIFKRFNQHPNLFSIKQYLLWSKFLKHYITKLDLEGSELTFEETNIIKTVYLNLLKYDGPKLEKAISAPALLDDDFFKNCEFAFKLLSTCKLTYAPLWEKLFESIHLKNNHTLWLEAWQSFQDLDQSLEGTPLEKAKAWYKAIETMPLEHVKSLYDLFGKEIRIVNVFKTSISHNLRNSIAHLIYENLLVLIKEEHSQAILEQSIKFREFLGVLCEKPFGAINDWNEADYRFAKILTSSGCSSLIIFAYKIILQLKQVNEADAIFANVLNEELNEEMANKIMPLFLSDHLNWTNNKIPLLSKTFKVPACIEFFKQTPDKSLQIITEWNNEILRSMDEQVELIPVFLNVILELISYSNLNLLTNWMDLICSYLENPFHSNLKPDLKPLLIKKINLIVQSFEVSRQKEAIKFLTLINKLLYKIHLDLFAVDNFCKIISIQIHEEKVNVNLVHLKTLFRTWTNLIEGVYNPYIMSVYFEFINRFAKENLKDEALTTSSDFLKKIDSNPILDQMLYLLIKSQNINMHGCLALMQYAENKSDSFVNSVLWKIFIEVYLPKELIDTSPTSIKIWKIIVEVLGEYSFECKFNVLDYINAFCETFSHSPNKEQGYQLLHQILSTTASSISKVQDKSKLLEKWLAAETKLKDIFSECWIDEDDMSLFKIEILLLAGDSKQTKWAISKLETTLQNLQNDIDVVLPACKWLILLIKTLSTNQKFSNEVENAIKEIFFKIKMVFPTKNNYPLEFKAIHQLYFEKASTFDNKTKLLDLLITYPEDFMTEEALALVIEFFRKEKMITSLQKSKMTSYLIEFAHHCENICTNKDIINVNLLKKAILTQPFLNKTKIPDASPKVFTDLIKIAAGCLDTIWVNVEGITIDRLKMLELIKSYLPLGVKDSVYIQTCFEIAMFMLTDLGLANNIEFFETEYKKFKTFINEIKFYPLPNDNKILIHTFLVKTLFLIPNYQTKSDFFIFFSDLFISEINELLECPHPQLSEIISGFINTFVVCLKDEKITVHDQPNWWIPHQKNMQKLVRVCFNKNIFKNEYTLLFQWMCLTGAKQIPYQDKIPQARRIEVLVKTIDDLIDQNSYIYTHTAISLIKFHSVELQLNLEIVKQCCLLINKSVSTMIISNLRNCSLFEFWSETLLDPEMSKLTNDPNAYRQMIVEVCKNLINNFVGSNLKVADKDKDLFTNFLKAVHAKGIFVNHGKEFKALCEMLLNI